MQRNWLGKSVHVQITFPTYIRYQPHYANVETQKTKTTKIIVDTKRPEILHGVQYLALSAQHPLVVNLAQCNADLKLFLDSLPSLPADSNAGFLLPGYFAQNPLARLPDPPLHVSQDLPVYVARYVTNNNENLAVMGVPGHDVRDRAFWNEQRHDDRVYKVLLPDGESGNTVEDGQSGVQQGAFLNSLCGSFAGLSSSQAAVEIVQQLDEELNLAKPAERWRLHDWLISRQRYWGTPIPVIHCRKCGPLPVPVDQLPVELPKVSGDWFKGKRGNPLEYADEWVNVACHMCGGPAKRETDTMDTFMDSSWYFMRYLDPTNTTRPFSARAADEWLPVDIYVGGVEHAILHLLYARFICKVLADNGFWPRGRGKQAEPFRKLITQGMVHGKTFSDPETGRFLKPEEIDLSDPSAAKMVNGAGIAKVSWEKMSKSKHNGVDPMECIKKYGADVTRAHILFQAPVTDVLEWDEEKIVGIQRWLNRIWRLTREVKRQLREMSLADMQDRVASGPILLLEEGGELYSWKMPPPHRMNDAELRTWTQVQNSIISVRSSLENTFTLNTVISDLMELTNSLNSTFEFAKPVVNFNSLHVLLRMLAPVAPAFAE